MRHLFWHILGLMYIEYGGEFEQFATAAKIRTVRVHKADSMTREELIGEIIKARINEARGKKIYCEGRWRGEGLRAYREREYEVIAELSGECSVSIL